MKIVSVGDVHGRDNWRKAVYLFDDAGNILKCLLGNEIDMVVFIGDYVDSWDLSNSDIFRNLQEIVNLKLDYPDNVILLWGNHDVAYLNNDGKISGYRYEMAPDLHNFFRDNRNSFQLSYQYKSTLWTHAGVHKGWWRYYVQPVLDGKVETRFSEFLGECKNYSDVLNMMFEFNYEPIYMVSHHRGGRNREGGPLWADKNEIYGKPFPGIHQVVGHTPVSCPKTYDFYDLTKVSFIDCMEKCDIFYKIVL